MDYALPVGPVRRELQRVLEDWPLWNGKTCVLEVTDFPETTMQLRCLVSANRLSAGFDLRCIARQRMISSLQNNDLSCLPTRRDAVTLLLANTAKELLSAWRIHMAQACRQ